MPNSLAERFRVAPGRRVQLARNDPADASAFPDRAAAEAKTREDSEVINDLQDRLYAEGRRALLVVLQGTDTAGKDGTIRSVFNDTGPLGVTVTAFRRPSEEELAHDFLWRVHQRVPSYGTIGLFNRSHYEDVLVARVKRLAPKRIWQARFRQINEFERLLEETGTTILKFFLHISRGEQLRRLRSRLDDPEKNWKFVPADLNDRALWDDYTEAYRDVLAECSPARSPWFVVPSDDKDVRDFLVAGVVVKALETMRPAFPKADPDVLSQAKRLK
jgi:PPK2 family polyphosphate:nucleotide phosphotransferase